MMFARKLSPGWWFGGRGVPQPGDCEACVRVRRGRKSDRVGRCMLLSSWGGRGGVSLVGVRWIY